jgi:hypothetical protein
VWEDGKFIRWNEDTDEEVDDPDAQAFRESMWGHKIQCGNCGDVIQSKHRHDFVTCKCGGTSVDGGSDYTRVLGSQWGFFSDAPVKSVQ